MNGGALLHSNRARTPPQRARRSQPDCRARARARLEQTLERILLRRHGPPLRTFGVLRCAPPLPSRSCLCSCSRDHPSQEITNDFGSADSDRIEYLKSSQLHTLELTPTSPRLTRASPAFRSYDGTGAPLFLPAPSSCRQLRISVCATEARAQHPHGQDDGQQRPGVVHDGRAGLAALRKPPHEHQLRAARPQGRRRAVEQPCCALRPFVGACARVRTRARARACVRACARACARARAFARAPLTDGCACTDHARRQRRRRCETRFRTPHTCCG